MTDSTSDHLRLDKREVRRSFEHAASSYDAAAVLQREVGTRMLERLDYIKCVPQCVLDVGSGTGGGADLRRRYPQAQVVALDFALAMLRQARPSGWRQWLPWSPVPAQVCADFEHLPIRERSVDMVWSNFALQWSDDPRVAFAEVLRVLKPQGLFMFSTFGPDTLRELREAYLGIDGYAHVSRFFDMHDLGDMLLQCGFADPVMDVERFTLTYAEVLDLMRELKAIGARNATQGRRRGLTGKGVLQAVVRNYETMRRDGRLPATYEVVYGHAWKPRPRVSADGRQIVHFDPRRRA
ncbi:MAG: malonyl-ACP O-methyltransferase BioC [Pseudomonadota bacterium]